MLGRKMLVALAAVSASVALNATAQAEPGGSFVEQGQSGKASWYGPGFHGRRTASGEIFNTREMTAAHRSLPFGTRVRVTNQRTGQSTVVRINDRGPYAHGRVIDLSREAAEEIGLLADGVGDVTLEVVGRA
jgi:rare lipoprotein A